MSTKFKFDTVGAVNCTIGLVVNFVSVKELQLASESCG